MSDVLRSWRPACPPPPGPGPCCGISVGVVTNMDTEPHRFSSSCLLIVLCSFLFIKIVTCLCLNFFDVFFITSFLFISFKHRLSRYSFITCGHCTHRRTHMNHQISRPVSPEPPSNCVSANDIPIAAAKSIREKKGIYIFLFLLVYFSLTS